MSNIRAQSRLVGRQKYVQAELRTWLGTGPFHAATSADIDAQG